MATTTIARLAVDLVANHARFGKDMRTARRHAHQFFGKIKKDARAVKGTVTAIGIAAAAAMSASAVQAKGFDQSLTKITTQVGIARTEVQGMRGDMLQIGNFAARDAKDIADGYFFVSSAGLRGATAMRTLAASAKGAAIGLGETQTVAHVSTSVLNAYGAANISAEKATGVLLSTVREGKADAQSIAKSLGNVIPIASELGVEFHEVGASIAAMTRTGATAETSVTQLSGILSKVIKPSQQAKAALAQVGLTTDDLRASLRDKGLFETLETLRSKFRGNEEALTRVFEDVQAVRGVFALVGESAEENRKIFERLAVSGVGTLDEAFKELQQSDSFKIDQSMAAISNAGVVLGGTVLPMVARGAQSVTSAVTGLTNWYSALDASQQETILTSAAVAAAIIPSIWAITKLAGATMIAARGLKLLTLTSFLTAKGSLKLAKTAVASFRAIALAASTAVAGITLPMALVGGAVIAAAAIFWTFRKEIGDALKPVGEFVHNSIWKPVDEVLSFVARKFSKFLSWLTTTAADALDAIGADDMAATLRMGAKSLEDFANGSGPVVGHAIVAAGKSASELASAAVDGTSKIIDSAVQGLEKLKQAGADATQAIASAGALPAAPNLGGDDGSNLQSPGITPQPDAGQNNLVAGEANAADTVKGIWDDLNKHYRDGQLARQQASAKTWGGLLTNAAASSKKMAKIHKAFNIGMVVMDTARAIMAAAPNIANMAFAAATGAVQLATIKGQFHGGIDNVPSTGTYLLESGERVVDKRLNRDLSAFLADAGQQTINNSRAGDFNPTVNMKFEGQPDPDAVSSNRSALKQALIDLYDDEALPPPFG